MVVCSSHSTPLSADYKKCEASDVKCGNDLCVPASKKCDGYYDCRDKVDEEGCGSRTNDTSCDLQEFRCRDGSRCIAKYQKCNHRKECTDGSDEENCSKSSVIFIFVNFSFSFFEMPHTAWEGRRTVS